jgi:small subunit ribosomal protein S7
MRGKQVTKRVLKADEVYNSQVVTKLINYTMLDGKKMVARKNVYQAIEHLGKETKMKPVEALEKALDNVKPRVEVRSRRVGGSNYMVPVQVPEERQISLALRWIIEAARKGRGSSDFWMSLSRELINAVKNEGSAIKKREEIKRMADANRAFAQFA